MPQMLERAPKYAIEYVTFVWEARNAPLHSSSAWAKV